MNEPVPTDGVSAYFDEELSASEHDVVVHHLSQSAAAKVELAEIGRLSAELRHLPRELAPHQVRSEVMNALADRNSLSARAGADPFSRGIVLAGKWLGAAAAVALLALGIPAFWKSSQTQDSPDAVAAHAPQAMKSPDRSESSAATIFPEETAAKRPNRVMLGSERELLSDRQTQQSLAKRDAPAVGVGPANSGLGGPAAPKALMLPDGDQNNSLATQDEAKQTDPLLGQILELANRNADRVVVVEVASNDLQQTLGQLQILLAENAVVPANFQLSPPQLPQGNEGQKLAEENLPISLFVQSSPQQLSAALTKLRERIPLSQIKPQTSLAMSSISLGERREILPNSRGLANRSRQSLDQPVQKYEAGQGMRRLGVDSAGFGKKPIADQPPTEKQTPNNLRPSEASPAPPGIAAPDAASFKFQGDLAASPQPVAASKSFQMIVRSPADRWANKDLDAKKAIASDDPAETKPAETKPAEVKSEPGQAGAARIAATAELAKEESPTVPIRVMFIFRQTAPAPAK